MKQTHHLTHLLIPIVTERVINSSGQSGGRGRSVWLRQMVHCQTQKSLLATWAALGEILSILLTALMIYPGQNGTMNSETLNANTMIGNCFECSKR